MLKDNLHITQFKSKVTQKVEFYNICLLMSFEVPIVVKMMMLVF
jgi:hypothetical protein